MKFSSKTNKKKKLFQIPKTGINLLPPELKIEHQRKRTLLQAAILGLTIFFLFLLIALWMALANYSLASALLQTKTQIASEESETAQLKEITQKVTQLNQTFKLLDILDRERIDWSAVLKELSATTPTQVQIMGLTLSKQTPNLTINGRAVSLREILRFQTKLESSSYFQNATLTSLQQTGEKESGYIFNLTVNLKKTNERNSH
jgi:Tfp pilus assembly protein PilN